MIGKIPLLGRSGEDVVIALRDFVVTSTLGVLTCISLLVQEQSVVVLLV